MKKPVTLYRAPFLAKGIHELADAATLEVLEAASMKRHGTIRTSLPARYPIETEFASGPVLAFKLDQGFTDPVAGITLTAQEAPILESAVVGRLIDRYCGRVPPRRADGNGLILLPLATQRMDNYFHWWLDSIAKIFVASKSVLLKADLASGKIGLVDPAPTARFQTETLQWLRPQLPYHWTDIPPGAGLLAGPAANSPGMSYGSLQRLGAMVEEYAQFLGALLPDLGGTHDAACPERIYVSRNESDMRRIVNEEALLPGLKAMGFDIVRPASLSLARQLALFRNARVIVSAHGAGLTNLLFCRSGARLVEIFPEGGVHGSAFLHICSHRDFDYGFIVGGAVENRRSRRNPNNSDIVLDVPSSLALIRDMIDG